MTHTFLSPSMFASALVLAAALFLTHSAWGASGTAFDGSVAAVLERVRHATGAPVSLAAHDLVVRGNFVGPMGPSDFVWRFGADGRFVRDSKGELDRRVGGDRDTSWMEYRGGRARRLEFADDENARLLTRVLSGQWLAPGSDVTVSAEPDSGDGLTRLSLAFARRSVSLAVDTHSGEPRTLTLRAVYAGETWSFADYRKDGGVLYPRRLEQTNPAGGTITMTVTSVALEKAAAATAFAMPTETHSTRFDSKASPELQLERSANGFLLVHPMIDGHEVGAFIFDTGAGANVITAKLADSLGLETAGDTWLGMAAGAAKSKIRTAKSLKLGPLTIKNPMLSEMDLSAISAQSGAEINGIIGYDVLMRARVEIEVERLRMSVQDPATAANDLPWQPIKIYGNHVYVKGDVEGHEGWFRLDTGAPQVPLILNGPTVARLDLLKGRDTKQAKIGVPGGTMDVALGTVEKLHLGGHTFDKLMTLFPLGSGGAFDDEYTLGNLGQECLKPFRAVFDYANSRMALVEVPQPPAGDATKP